MKSKICFLILLFFASSALAQNWSRADRSSAGLAPLPEHHPEAIVQVYAARTVRWRGYFAVHTWIATKAKDAESYKTYHVIGFRLKRTGSAVVIEDDVPDRRWYGALPQLVTELRGSAAEKAIPSIESAAAEYPYHGEYTAWPGPNSNTFTSYILRRVPELGVELPPHAIGKDWLAERKFLGVTESKTGIQMSFFGLLGFTVGLAEGVEVNLLGLSFGVDVWRPALKIPLVGRIGFDDAPVFTD